MSALVAPLAQGAPAHDLIDLSLNNGTYCSPRCIEVLHAKKDNTALRHYAEGTSAQLRQHLAERHPGLLAEHVFLHQGSGAILRLAAPHILRREILKSWLKTARHLLFKSGYPMVTPVPTYGKAVQKMYALGFKLGLLPLDPEHVYRLDPERVATELKRRDALVYLCNPNNPTGLLLLATHDIEALAQRFPRSFFWVDEAYIEYIPGEAGSAALPARCPNVCVSRSFSFAYGLAAARMGYLVAEPSLVRELEHQVVEYRIGALTEELVVAALADDGHLGFVQDDAARGRALILEEFVQHPRVCCFSSLTNFVLFQTLNGLTATEVASGMLARGIKIKTFDALGPYTYPDLFRVTLGTPEENEALVAALHAVVAV